MSKKIIFVVAILVCSFSLAANNKKVAVFDPAGSVDNFIKEVVREEISSILVNTDGYIVLERQLINKVLEENRFQASGLVDDSEISAMGKLMGANLVFVTSITKLNESIFHLSFKVVDVQTARIEKQKTAQTQRGTGDLIFVVQNAVGEMFGQTGQAPQQAAGRNGSGGTLSAAGMLIADGTKVYRDGKPLSQSEVRQVMSTNINALQKYNKGLARNESSGKWITAGGSVVIIGGVIAAAGFGEVDDPNVWFAIGLAGVGAGAIIAGTGLIIGSVGKKNIKSATDIYNRGGRFLHAELNFGVTQHGIGLVLNF